MQVKMYDPIFAKSFSRNERRRVRCGAIVLSFIIAFTIFSTLKPHLHHLSMIGEAENLQLSINTVEDLLIIDEAKENPKQNKSTVGEAVDLQLSINGVEDFPVSDGSNENSGQSEPIEIEKTKTQEPLCRILESDADYCEIEGDIRIQPNTSTIFVLNPHETFSSNSSTNSWTIQPYPRRGITHVKHWTIKLERMSENTSIIPNCDQSHTNPALLFSVGGYSGNHFHAFADVIFPLYSTSFRFQKRVHFLASDYSSWWIQKYKPVFDQLSENEIVDIEKEQARVHCFPRMVAGLKFHREFIVHPHLFPSRSQDQPSMKNFRELLRETYSLERKRAVRTQRGSGIKPRLLIVSRKRTRILTNEDEVSRTANKMGFEVVSAEARVSTNLSEFARIVNRCDVMVGIHGAGLTNMVFLPDNAVLIQVVPWGGIDVFAKLDFGDPAAEMNLRYLEYKITVEESSLSRQHSMDDPVIKDPMLFHRKGWDVLRSVYLDNQNVTIDIHRFKGTLAKALKFLRR